MFRVSDVMTRQVVYLSAETPLDEAARVMKESDIGDVVVTDGATLAGMLTDRDIVVRAVAERADPGTTTIGSIITREVVMIEQHCTANEAAALMRERNIRRVLVCDSDRKLVGIVSLGDLAMQLDPHSALSDISEAAPNV
ncbi:CBS domain-containing protein [Micromonospora aurantiaca]|uniref:CBS domain-containing protein n=1 Tax=Micromonospora aurantiaca (nom. illeg.) TaxID=47850 RepID=A0A1C6TCK4_9ACTN|nr:MULTISPECIES: CBS domain-containing protein [Micromonospora]ADL43615.1 CBS domain containing protein [Micromonospora aurantiaca ATCC 27029]ADU05583.1 putative signal transduction protein with CBS domains [Micromonospora sp. L5]AXH89901.1 CBS domain-containing protein [Micromonospora aurantiaca]KAB1108266.1 CBS domain-containing protein [Micromonospora aurantiaca]MBC9002540.1 CBS domain-containing protein [Micromonospora aurantiaca]